MVGIPFHFVKAPVGEFFFQIGYRSFGIGRRNTDFGQDFIGLLAEIDIEITSFVGYFLPVFERREFLVSC